MHFFSVPNMDEIEKQHIKNVSRLIGLCPNGQRVAGVILCMWICLEYVFGVNNYLLIGWSVFCKHFSILVQALDRAECV